MNNVHIDYLDLDSDKLNAVSRTNLLIKEAIGLRVTDIHIDPVKDSVNNHLDGFARIRVRIDGVIAEYRYISRRSYQEIVARIKVLSRLRTDIRHLPQDGRFEISGISIRVSSVPVVFGESIVLRILNTNNYISSFVDLGFDTSTCVVLEQALCSPHGLIIVAGPTGSGKTTVLYSLMNYINSISKSGLVNRSIITIEDPVERVISFARQIPVRESLGLDFSTLLRSVLRQDPDVIIVGEIRDEETALMAVGAAMTGHLVIATLHTSYADRVKRRLKLLGVDEQLFNSVHILSLAIRLVRRLCKPCHICSMSGWFGRTVISEYIHHNNRSKNIYENGIQKVHQGITTKDEIDRVVDQNRYEGDVSLV